MALTESAWKGQRCSMVNDCARVHLYCATSSSTSSRASGHSSRSSSVPWPSRKATSWLRLTNQPSRV
jgi:hypothetical protein